MRLTWVQPEDLLLHAFVQARDEGVDVSDVERDWTSAGGTLDVPVSGAADVPARHQLREVAARLLVAVDELAPASHTDVEPAVRRVTATGRLPVPVAADLAERVHGAWLGRCAGCLLGKPVEKVPRQGIEEILRDTGRWPLEDWFTEADLSPEVAARWPWNRRSAPTSLAENIDGMPEDDDLNFAVLALRMLDRHGRDLTTEAVAQAWLDNLPGGRVFTAERVAYRNLLNGVDPDRAALVANPFREWIGALIRADVHGWAHPGDLASAVSSVAVDARLTHTGAGVEGALWAAALASAALVCDDVAEVLDLAGRALEPDGTLDRSVRRGIELGRGDFPDGEALDALHAELGSYHWVHVVNNAATIAFALARGGGDFGRSIGLAVTAGWDTDSVGATVGGVVGALLGADGIPSRWTAPLDNRLATSLPGPPELPIDVLASQTFALTGVPR